MSDWLSEDPLDDGDRLPLRPRAERALRAIDVALAAPLLLVAGVPLWCLRRRIVREPVRGKDGQPFDRLRLALPPGRVGRLLTRLGAAGWPVLLNVLRGEMAWVGPRPRALAEPATRAATRVRPGLVNPWYVRLRTAVHFGSESQADRQYLAQRGVGHDLGLLLRGALVSLLPPPAAQAPQRVQVGDVWFDNIDMTEAVQRLRALLDGAQPQQVSFVNPACVNVAAGHRGYRRALARAALVLPDGIGIKVGSLILGTPLKQNVNGTDLFPRLCEMLQARGSSVFLLGGQPGVGEAVAAEIARRWPELRVAGVRHGYFAVAEEGDVAAQVRRSGADVLLVARGVPAQDLFIDRYLPLLGARLALGVGGLFDFVSGRISRAPLWMRETGLEWVWRLMQEPGRMWRRYLVGNFTFLARMALQRAGLRRPAGDTAPAPRPAAAPQAAVRAVIFATDAAGADLPLSPSAPAGLLPVGHQTVVEHLLGHLAAAAVTDVDVVVSEQPEGLRALLEDGERWGLRLRWHLVKDPARPYAALAAAARATSRRLIVLHCDHLPSARTVARLAERDRLELHALGEDGPRWTGWSSVPPAPLHHLPADLDRAALQRTLLAMALPAAVADATEGCALTSAACVLEAQQRALTADGLGDVPASWIRRPWGAMSPLATVDPRAAITGPALVGPGCWVQRGAQIGPVAVLSRDVVVSSGTRVRGSLVLPGTYLGPGLDVDGAIVNGTRVRHVGLDIEMALAESDALMLALEPRLPARPGVVGRAVASALWAVAAGPLLWHALSQRLAGRAPAWTRRAVVTGRDPASRAPLTAVLYGPRGDAQGRDAAWAALMGLADVAAGRRCWFGMRARSVGQWYALRPEWQDVLAARPVGLLHCPAWSGDRDAAAEAEAVADVFAATLPVRALAWQCLGAAPFARRRQKSPGAAGGLPATLPSR